MHKYLHALCHQYRYRQSSVVGLCVSVCVGHVHTKMAELIEMLFGGLIRMGPRNHVRQSQNPHRKAKFFGGCPAH